MSSKRSTGGSRLAWLLAAAGLGAWILGRPPAEPPPASVAAAAPSPVLKMMGLAAPIAGLPEEVADATAPDEPRPDWMDLRDYPLAVLALQRAPLDAETRQQRLQTLLARWAEAAPEQAARWARDTPGQAALLAPLHDRWLQHDARSATVFARSLPAGPQRQALLDESLSRWTAQDGPAARDWLRSYAPLAELDTAIAHHASADELARHAPHEAMDLVTRIADPERRWRAWQALARNLHDIDPDRAAVLLSQAPGLWPAERERLFDELR
ncbi:hypothetical protein [Roseateles asaccharophilus]|uniref:DUF3106 domain-containing protein n=1 Tax=Roseateles asaccharophilus TaxID=582607 RepID=A0ABU2AF93_9BURK|nr:hypothetical protein [Roseateles asaccharophilus]MDR7335142.1 hypothetical protein [Roseateles asaccharophilus]